MQTIESREIDYWLLGWSRKPGEKWKGVDGETSNEDYKMHGEPYSFPSHYHVAICVLRLLLKTKTQ